MRHIVCLSGGLSSAWVANWAAKQGYEPILYFNDTKWEHPDLYRFLHDIERVVGIKITEDSDGRDPEQVFYDQNMLGNNRVPLCSKILKAERLQKYVCHGDIVYFGIDMTELHRAERIMSIYSALGVQVRFPLIDKGITKAQVCNDIVAMGIEIPELYRRGFSHNNCSGGCVRAGLKSWALLLREFPEVYAERERIEEEMGLFLGKPVTFMKKISLRQLREIIQSQRLLQFDDDEKTSNECIGICNIAS